MKVAILGGGGAMGGLFGGWLARAGLDVTLVDVSTEAVDVINRSGLRIDEKDGSTATIRVAASCQPEKIGTVDLILTFVKCYHTAGAVSAALPIMHADTVLLSLQNGWGNAERIAEIAGRRRVVAGLTYHSCTLVAPGHLRHTGSGPTHLGELDGTETPHLEAVSQALASAGFEVSVSSHIVDEIWKKLALNVCTLPTAALLGFPAHRLNQHQGTRDIMRALLSEVGQVARAQGIQLDEAERWDAITGLLDRAVGARGSMVQDVEARRPTEIDVINGAIVTAGRRYDIATPFNSAMVWMIQSLQESYRDRQA